MKSNLVVFNVIFDPYVDHVAEEFKLFIVHHCEVANFQQELSPNGVILNACISLQTSALETKLRETFVQANIRPANHDLITQCCREEFRLYGTKPWFFLGLSKCQNIVSQDIIRYSNNLDIITYETAKLWTSGEGINVLMWGSCGGRKLSYLLDHYSTNDIHIVSLMSNLEHLDKYIIIINGFEEITYEYCTKILNLLNESQSCHRYVYILSETCIETIQHDSYNADMYIILGQIYNMFNKIMEFREYIPMKQKSFIN